MNVPAPDTDAQLSESGALAPDTEALGDEIARLAAHLHAATYQLLEEAELEAERHRSRYLRLYPEEDGSWVLRGRLDPEVGALLQKAMEWAGEALYREERGEVPAEAETTAERGRAARPREGIPVDPGCAVEPEIRFFRPDGRLIPLVPKSPPVPAEATEELVQNHKRKGIVPDAWTATPLWHGEVFDLGMAVEALRGDPHGFNAVPAYHEDFDVR